MAMALSCSQELELSTLYNPDKENSSGFNYFEVI